MDHRPSDRRGGDSHRPFPTAPDRADRLCDCRRVLGAADAGHSCDRCFAAFSTQDESRIDQIVELNRKLDDIREQVANLARQVAPPALFHTPNALKAAERIIAARARRQQFFPPDLFGEPIWDMLLDLYVSRAKNRQISVSSLSIASRAPATTALRHIVALERIGMIERQSDPFDKRRTFLRIVDQTFQNMTEWLVSLETEKSRR